MNNSEKFQTILSDLNAADYDAMREFIRDTVRAEWGTLIEDLRKVTYPEMSEDMPADPFVESPETKDGLPPFIVEFLRSIGINMIEVTPNRPERAVIQVEIRRVR